MSTERSFEQRLEELEARVRELESGEVPLDRALVLFEEGVELAQQCHEQLDEADKRVASLTRSGTGITETPIADVEESSRLSTDGS